MLLARESKLEARDVRQRCGIHLGHPLHLASYELSTNSPEDAHERHEPGNLLELSPRLTGSLWAWLKRRNVQDSVVMNAVFMLLEAVLRPGPPAGVEVACRHC